MLSRRDVLVVGLALPALAAGTAASYPSRPIKMIVPYPPGGADVMARLLADRLAAALGQPVIVENRGGGGGGTVGTKVVATAEPDGHTLLFTSPGPLTTSAAVYKNLDYDPIRSFAPIATIAVSPFLVVVHPSVPATTMQELIAYAKANPGKISFASVGHGTLPHLFGEMLKQRTGIEMIHVPYRGSGAAITDLLAGQVQMYIDNTRNILAFVQAGKLRALAVTSETRAPELPALPTMPRAAIRSSSRPIGTACWRPPPRPTPSSTGSRPSLRAPPRTRNSSSGSTRRESIRSDRAPRRPRSSSPPTWRCGQMP